MSSISVNEEMSDNDISDQRYRSPTPMPQRKPIEKKFGSAGTSTSKNAFINFLAELRKATPNMKLSGAQTTKIGAGLWKEMTEAQKERFKIVEARRRRRKGVRKGGKQRRRRRSRRSSRS